MNNLLMRTESVPMEGVHHVPNKDTLLDYQGIGLLLLLFSTSLMVKALSVSAKREGCSFKMMWASNKKDSFKKTPCPKKNTALVTADCEGNSEEAQAANQGNAASSHTIGNSGLIYINQITLIAREFLIGERNSFIRVNQGEKQILSPLAAFICQQTARLLVGEHGQGMGICILKKARSDSTTPRDIFLPSLTEHFFYRRLICQIQEYQTNLKNCAEQSVQTGRSQH